MEHIVKVLLIGALMAASIGHSGIVSARQGIDEALAAGSSAAGIELTKLGTFETGVFGGSAAEILTFDASTDRLFVQNADAATIDIIDISEPDSPFLVNSINPDGQPTNVDAYKGVVAVTVEGETRQDPGAVVFFDSDGVLLNRVPIGSRPDMLVFSPNGNWLLTANEGVPSDDYSVDPEGSISIIDMRRGVEKVTADSVRTADLRAFNDADLDPSVRIFGPGATVAQDLEPEHITVSHDSRTAWVSFQENNAIGVIDVRRAQVTDVIGLGFKDHSQPGNGLDPSNRDDRIAIDNWPVLGMYQPDAIASYRTGGKTYVVTANEGDARDYDGYSEETRVEDLVLDPGAFPNAAELQSRENLGRLKTTTATGDTDGDGDTDEIYAYGARSFSIRDADGRLVFDSGDDFERITASLIPSDFNSNDDENSSFDARSDDKGPEPEYVVVGKISGRSYAFVGLERVGGIMVYDVTEPSESVFVDYLNTRDFSGDPELGTAGDLSPEGLKFIKASDSPTGNPLLAVGFEVSGTVGVFEIAKR